MLSAHGHRPLSNHNNKFTHRLPLSNSFNSSFDETCELSSEKFHDSRADFLPSIHAICLNNSKSRNVNYNNTVDTSTGNRNHKIGSAKKQDKSVADEEPLSKIYIKNKSDQKIYLLEFQATNVKLVPVYLKHRTFEENLNDKCNQPYSKASYYNYYNNKSIKFNQMHKTYSISQDKNSDELSIMSSKKPLFKKPVVSHRKPHKPPSISKTESNLQKSVIFLRYKNMDFEVYPGIMELSLSELIDVEGDKKRNQLLKELNMKQPTDLKNKAKIIVKHKGDVLKFFFTLSEITYSKVRVTKSVGIEVNDDQVYSKIFSSVTDRPVYISVPKSIYNYRDPLVDIRRENMSNKLANIIPYWKEEQRKKRIKEYNQCRKKSVYADIMDLKIGSKVCYEGFNCINKAKGGTFACATEDDEYENWVISNQKTERVEIEDENAEKFESTFTDEVPDWDLVIYSK